MYISSLFLIGMMLMLTVYLSIKNNKIILITDGFFSIGDILFLAAVIPLFHFNEYIIFFTIGTSFTLFIHLIVQLYKKQNTIPYAGYMSLVTISFLFLKEQIPFLM